MSLSGRDLLVFGGIGAAAVSTGSVELPAWWGVAGGGLLMAGIAAVIASGKIDDLIPDPPTVTLVVINAKETSRVETWELSMDKYAELQVKAGTLNPLSESLGEAYECYHYNPDSNVAVGTWRESRPHSEIVGHHEIGEALNIITELVNHLEPQAQYGKYVRDNLVSIVRRLDRERAAAQNAALEGHLAPSMGGLTIDDVLRDEVPDELLPSRLKNDDIQEESDEWANGMDLIIEDDAGEALEPVGELRNDGGPA
ncbi:MULTISPECIES: hypothetical protein [Haloferax]|uniref:DUF8125 domain-containing protein n=1 Tax=Haloferax larsenii TaxID=302484 RepID=A0A1H7KJA7_HALLR|nr:hypothetical protein [Haloferax larsenii]SEK86868.1 hypothetical protein SAMN04488691_10223 [Haloferax larsenii]